MEPKLSILIEQAPIGIVTFSAEGVIDYVNRNFEKFGILYQFETTDLTGKIISEVQLFPDIDLTNQINELQTGISFEKEIKHVKTNDGGQITLIVKGTPLYEEANFAGGILLIEDIKVLSETRDELNSRADYIEKAIRKVNEFLIVTDSTGDVQFSAGSNLDKFNLSQGGIEGKNIVQLFSSDVKTKIAESIESIIQFKSPQKFNFEIESENKSYFFECKVEPLLNRRETIQFIYFFFDDKTSDKTERTNLQKEINELNLYRSAAEQTNTGLFTISRDGTINFWDEYAEKILGKSKDNVLGKNIATIIEAVNDNYLDELANKLLSEKSVKVNIKILGEENKKITELKFSYLAESKETIVVFCTDITYDFDNTEKLASSEKNLKAIVNHTSELICKTDEGGNVLYANSNFFNKLGYTEKEIYTKNIFNLISSKVSEEQIAAFNNFPSKPIEKIELQLASKQGKVINVIATLTPVIEKDFNGKRIYCYLTDVTNIKTSRFDLRIFKSLFESANDGIAVELEGKFALVNNSFAKIFGYESADQLEGKDVLDLVSNDDVLKVAEYFRLREGRKHSPDRFEFLGKRRDNSYFYAEISVSDFEADSNVCIVMVARDVTERKRAQKAIRESEEKYRNLTENIDDFLYTFEKTGKYLRPVFYTSSVERVTGYTQTDFLSDSNLFLKLIHPDDLSFLKKKLRSLIKSKHQLSIELEFRIINKHGNIVWTRNKVNLLRNADGSIQKIYGLVSDVTLRKRAEEELKQSAENLKKVNETKDRFISIVSHDLRTPFSSILGFTDLLSNDDTLNEEERKQYVKYIQESSRAMLSLVNSLLDWTRLQTGRIKFEPQKSSAIEVIQKSLNTVTGAALQKGIKINLNVPDNYEIFADKNLILQALNNLLSNAVKFTSKGDSIAISAKPSAKNRYLEISVSDTGRGIRAENLEKLFKVDTKFTSEGTAGEKGSGLGLSLVKEIIEKHGGDIWVKSEFGKGSDFRFTIPVASAIILIVDDNKTDSILYSKILKNITPDYAVERTSNGHEALDIMKNSPPALIITEHQMPEMDGIELVQNISKDETINNLPIIVLSRKIGRSSSQKYSELGVEFIFQKPVNLASFKMAIEKCLLKSIPNGTVNVI